MKNMTRETYMKISMEVLEVFEKRGLNIGEICALIGSFYVDLLHSSGCDYETFQESIDMIVKHFKKVSKNG